MADSPQESEVTGQRSEVEKASAELSKLAPLEPPLSKRALIQLAKDRPLSTLQLHHAINKSAGIVAKPKGEVTGRRKDQYTFRVAKEICELLSVSVDSMVGLCRAHSDWPDYKTIIGWKYRIPKFAQMLATARERQAEYIAQTCLDLARTATPQNAHAIRIKFDIARWYASKILPSIYGDKPQAVNVQTTVQVAISPQKLQDIRERLEQTRSQMSEVRLKREQEAHRLGNGTNGDTHDAI